ncbi:hypothetical protein PPERSA_04805 [Pseudocohnilembus persalinus]|uniref:Uncharacterized protein n=1 Tax=Pseudocohnilembus persalinus TaxID=266149 RepID=A0A0V0QL94_PSEPJ|nr:hypothetical protein PPERSA_04805 [Pseudocohnilembus persalinus]|eukprot:KRX03010.1 hypothetical protein PPERSA_04805 [Pseudocohnilembus persalinus]
MRSYIDKKNDQIQLRDVEIGYLLTYNQNEKNILLQEKYQIEQTIREQQRTKRQNLKDQLEQKKTILEQTLEDEERLRNWEDQNGKITEQYGLLQKHLFDNDIQLLIEENTLRNWEQKNGSIKKEQGYQQFQAYQNQQKQQEKQNIINNLIEKLGYFDENNKQHMKLYLQEEKNSQQLQNENILIQLYEQNEDDQEFQQQKIKKYLDDIENAKQKLIEQKIEEWELENGLFSEDFDREEKENKYSYNDDEIETLKEIKSQKGKNDQKKLEKQHDLQKQLNQMYEQRNDLVGLIQEQLLNQENNSEQKTQLYKKIKKQDERIKQVIEKFDILRNNQRKH